MESLSVVFMEIGRSSPRHEKLALLYPRSSDLQAYLNEYFIVVVRFCYNIQQYAQKSAFRQFASAMGDSTIKTTQNELESWAKQIKEEMEILLVKRIEEEAQENARFRSLSTRFSKLGCYQQDLVARLRILNQCSSYDHQTTWKQLKKCGNTRIFADTPEYIDWKTQNSSCTLLYLGILGCGKSVTMANIVDDLNLSIADNENTSIAYFFVRHDIVASLEARTMIGAIVQQLLSSSTGLGSYTSGTKNDTMDIENLDTLLRRAVPSQQKVYIVLDGLDLCDSVQRHDVTQFLQRLQSYYCLHLCVSYRQESSPELDTTLENCISVQSVSLPNNSADIEAFVQMELERRLENRTLVLGDPTLILEVQKALLKGSEGMFLWVVLQIHTLCTYQTDLEIREALACLPHDLSEIYQKLLHRQQSIGDRYQTRIFELILAAQRPLTTREMREALSVAPGDTTWSAAKLINDVYSALATCGCLVIVDEEELTVRFVHHTVQQFLLETYRDSMDQPMSIAACHKTMAELTATYLSYGIFTTHVSTLRIPQINVGSTPTRVIQSTMASSKRTQEIALKLLRVKKRRDIDIGNILAKELWSDRESEALRFDFHHYAKKHCFLHVTKTQAGSDHIKELLPQLLKDIEISQQTPVLRKTQNSVFMVLHHRSAYVRAMTIAAEANNVNVLRMLLGLSEEVHDIWYIKAVLQNDAVCSGFEDVVHLLSHKDSGTLSSRYVSDNKDSNMLCYWAYQVLVGERSYIKHRSDAEIRHVCQSGRSLLSCAIWGRNEHMIQAFLGHSRTNINAGRRRMTPIWEAVRVGHRLVVEQLIECGSMRWEPGERADLIALATSFGNLEPLHHLFETKSQGDIEIKWSRACDDQGDPRNEDESNLTRVVDRLGRSSVSLWNATAYNNITLLRELLPEQQPRWTPEEKTALFELAWQAGRYKIAGILKSLPEDAFLARHTSPASAFVSTKALRSEYLEDQVSE